jgi:8-oxo-dGTP pyrophosphatase MutT (NUDIX family)
LITLADVRAALALHPFDATAAHARMFPGGDPRLPPLAVDARQAGVLVLLYPAVAGPRFVLTRRAATLRGHSGQISFPGGRRDPDDVTFSATALRETCEELGICDSVELLGDLTPIYIPPSNFRVHPSVGALADTPSFTPNPAEVAEVFTVPLTHLLDPAYKRHETWELAGRPTVIPFYAFGGHQVWGATAIMLSELEVRLRAVLNAV